jgi:regulator of replication initiation timing
LISENRYLKIENEELQRILSQNSTLVRILKWSKLGSSKVDQRINHAKCKITVQIRWVCKLKKMIYNW